MSGRQATEILTELFKKSIETKLPGDAEAMKMLKIKSNYARNKSVSIADMVVYFNEKGEGLVPDYKKDVVDEFFKHKQGRFSYVEDHVVKPAVVHKEVQVPVLVEKLISESGEPLVEVELLIGKDEVEYTQAKPETKKSRTKKVTGGNNES